MLGDDMAKATNKRRRGREEGEVGESRRECRQSVNVSDADSASFLGLSPGRPWLLPVGCWLYHRHV